MKKYYLFLILFCVPLIALAQENIIKQSESEHINNLYHKLYSSDNDPIPKSLYETYKNLTIAMKNKNSEKIKEYCLLSAITITVLPRPKENEDYGTDINWHFIETKFDNEILGSRKEPQNCFLIRTSTSYFHFIETKKDVWKLYRYGDKPME